MSEIIRSTRPICCLCGRECENIYGNNPAPLSNDGVCCDDCNSTKVIPARCKAFALARWGRPIKE